MLAIAAFAGAVFAFAWTAGSKPRHGTDAIAKADGASSACSWRITPLPRGAGGYGQIWSVSQPPRGGGAWAVVGGDLGGTLVLQWTGRRWRVVPRPWPKVVLYDVVAISNRNVWFGGGVIQRWNGTRVSDVAGDYNGGIVESLSGTKAAMWDLSNADDYTYLSRWDGQRWKSVDPGAGGQENWDAISGRSSTDLWAGVGGGWGATDVAHWDGADWDHISDPAFQSVASDVSDVLDLGPRDVWTVGDGEAVHFDGVHWTVTPGSVPRGGPSDLAIAGLPRGPIYVAGSGARLKARVLRWTGRRWVREPVILPKRPSTFISVSVGRNGEVWAGGFTYRKHGELLRRVRPLMEHCTPRVGT